ncbi:hypothetical protein [Methanobacterium sp. CWC-01]|nr:hypothetical protein [Methanobacterium sp. CWC-01]
MTWDVLEGNLPPEKPGEKTEKELREEAAFLKKANLKLQSDMRGD